MSEQVNKARIFVVEDEAIVAADIKECLESFGYTVGGTARSGEEAIAQLKSVSVDLVLMDIRIAGKMDGIDTAERIKNELSLPVVYLTAHADPETLERAKVTEPYGYILKPFNEMEMRAVIELAIYRANSTKASQKSNGKEAADFLAEHALAPEKMSPARREAFDLLRRIGPLAGMDPKALSALSSFCRFEDIAAGDIIAFEGEDEVSGFIVVSGRIALVKSSPSGKELIVDLVPPGDAFGLLAAVEQKSYPASARAQVASKILWTPRELVLSILDTYPEVAREFFDKSFARLRQAQNLARGLAHDLVETRVAAALTSMMPVFSRTTSEEGHEDTFRLEIKRQELADMTGSTAETVIRITKDMERGGLLDLAKAGVIVVLDAKAIKAMAEPN